MIEINLIPDVKQELIRAQKARSVIISFSILFGIIFTAVVIILAAYAFGVQTVRSSILDGAIKDGSEKLASVEDLTKTLTIQNQLTKISDLHNDKKIASRVFDMLDSIIPPAPNNVQISNLTIDYGANLITIEGQAANSYAAVEVFTKTIEGAKVKFKYEEVDEEVDLASNIITGDTSYGEDASGNKVLRFNISFNYENDLFSPNSKQVAIEITNQGNATDSFIGVPKSIFVDRAKDITEEQ